MPAPNNLVPQTLAELRFDLRTLLGDAQSISVSWSDQAMNQALNYAVQLYLKLTEKSYTEYSLSVTTTGKFQLPNAYMQVDRIGFGSPNQWLLQSSVREETNKNPNWENTQCTVNQKPKRWAMYDGTTIFITPRPYATSTATIGYLEEPVNMTLDNDVCDPRVPINYQRFLKYAAAYWLLYIDGDNMDVQLAAAMMQQFVENIKETK